MTALALYYVVPGMELVKQDKDMACWYASAQMVIRWRRNRVQMSELGVVDPSEDTASAALYSTNLGIQDAQIVDFAKRLGLRRIPPMSPTPEAVCQWLQRYGPLWTNGSSHITVIGGIRSDPTGTELLVYDPSPNVKKNIEWRDMTKWYTGGSVSSRDTTTNAGIFLYMPD